MTTRAEKLREDVEQSAEASMYIHGETHEGRAGR